VTKFHDPLIMANTPEFLVRPNPITQKYYNLTRDVGESGAKDLTPDVDETARINEVLDMPDFLSLSDPAKSLLWHFRYSLVPNKRALVKFLLAVDWSKEKEELESMSLLKSWAEIDIDQALPMLSYLFSANEVYKPKAGTSFPNYQSRFNEIRAIAVKCLEKQSPEQINSIMLQLVQAYRYECFSASPLRRFLLSKTVRNETLAYTMHWHVKLEKENEDNGPMQQHYEQLYKDFMAALEVQNKEVYQNLML
jgi:phosphatidylinositol 3-kinase